MSQTGNIPQEERGARLRAWDGGEWPDAFSDGLSLSCSDCGQTPRFDHIVADTFWERWVPGREARGVICLPCLDRRCGGTGLAAALQEVQWLGTGHTVRLNPLEAVTFDARSCPPEASTRLDQAARILELEAALGELLEEADLAATAGLVASDFPLERAASLRRSAAEARRVLRGEKTDGLVER